jgi:hypothetical protein
VILQELYRRKPYLAIVQYHIVPKALFTGIFAQSALLIGLFVYASQHYVNADQDASNENIEVGLKNTNYGFIGQDAYEGSYLAVGHMDYRPRQQSDIILNKNAYQIPNGDSYAPVINYTSDYLRDTNDLIENAVYFDGHKSLGNYHHDGLEFRVTAIPNKTQKIRTSIAYLKGFSAHDENGDELVVQKAENGNLQVTGNGTASIVITYNKTKLHILGIIISSVTWITLIYKAFTKDWCELLFSYINQDFSA